MGPIKAYAAVGKAKGAIDGLIVAFDVYAFACRFLVSYVLLLALLSCFCRIYVSI